MERVETAPTLRREHFAWLLPGLGLVVAPHAPRLALWVPAGFVLLVAWRLGALFRGWPLPGDERWLLSTIKRVLALGAFAGVYLSYGAQIGRDAGTALLVVLVGLKLVEASTGRDYYLLLFLGYFLVITNFLFSQSIPTAFIMLLALAVFTAALVRFNDLNGRMTTSLCASLAGRLLAQALPLMLGAFVLFPRIDGPLWGLPKDAHSGLTGLDEEMSPGAISRLGLSDAVAFRVEFGGALPKPLELYWRGPVLWDSDGRTWTGGEEVPQGPSPLYVFDQGLDYAVTLEPHNRRWLFALEMPSITPPGTALSSDLQLLAARPVTRRMRYRARSHPRFRVFESTPSALARALRLPARSHPRALALARRWRQQVREPGRIVSQALAYFREQPFFYTLSPPPLEKDTIDEFLFDTRRGFCEHYAAAFTVLMRAAGVPARIVTGYQGGDYNPLGRYLVVRQRDAHAWSEVWLEGNGWVRVDPTGAVSPTRVEQGVETVFAEELTIIPWGWSENAVLMQWWRGARNALDAVNHGWNQWVLGYGERRQARVMQKLGMEEPTARSITFWFAVVVTTLAMAAWVGLRRESVQDPTKALYQRFCNRLARRGIRRHAYEGPVSFAQRACTHCPDLSPHIRAITDVYVDLRYADAANGIVVLRRLVGNFRPGPRAG